MHRPLLRKRRNQVPETGDFFFNSRRFKNLLAPRVRSDFNYGHGVWLFQVQETLSAFHPLAQRTAFRRRNARVSERSSGPFASCIRHANAASDSITVVRHMDSKSTGCPFPAPTLTAIAVAMSAPLIPPDTTFTPWSAATSAHRMLKVLQGARDYDAAFESCSNSPGSPVLLSKGIRP